MNISNKEKKELADNLVKRAYKDFSDDEKNAYTDAGFMEWENIPELLHFNLYAINPNDIKKIKKQFPDIIIGGLEDD